jgi:hypothetical protein
MELIMTTKIAMIKLEADWKLLQEQKLELLKVIKKSASRKEDDVANGLTGLLHLIDGIQDQAAEQLGEDVVFSESGEYEISLPDIIKNDGTYMSYDSGLNKAEALKIAQERYGADEQGCISIINRIN